MDAFKAGGLVNNKVVKDNEAALLSKFEDNGAKVNRPELAPFRAAMEPSYKELDSKFGEGIVEKLSSLAD